MEINSLDENIIKFPYNEPKVPTPVSDKIINNANKLKSLSRYDCQYDFEIYRKLELRFGENQPRGSIIFNSPFKLVNSHTTCQQCLYSFEIDTYGRGCTHDCVYCYAKAELTVHGWWNKPFPMPIDISEVWKTFYTVFETNKASKWREVIEKKVPLRIGSMSDSFMHMDRKYKVTQELLKILNFYEYPYVIFTRSDLVADDDYIELLNPKLCSIQMSIASIDDELNKQIEPGTPSAKRRLKALEKLVQAGFWTTVRINPFIPMYADGYYTDPEFDKINMPKPFHFSSYEMIDEIAKTGCKSILTGVVRLSSYSINQMEKATGRELRNFYKEDVKKNSRDFHYSDKEVRAYYERIQIRCLQNNIEFTTCYIGNGEAQFWRDQDLWSNKADCCNIKGKVEAFKTDSRQIEWSLRLKHTNYKLSLPNDMLTIHKGLNSINPIEIIGAKVQVKEDFLLQ